MVSLWSFGDQGVASSPSPGRESPDVPLKEDHVDTPNDCLPSRYVLPKWIQCVTYICVTHACTAVIFTDAVLYGLSHETSYTETRLTSRHSFPFATIERTVSSIT